MGALANQHLSLLPSRPTHPHCLISSGTKSAERIRGTHLCVQI